MLRPWDAAIKKLFKPKRRNPLLTLRTSVSLLLCENEFQPVGAMH